MSWTELTLGDCVSLLSGGTPSKKNPDYWGGEIPWVSPKDLGGTHIYDSQDHVTELGAANGTRRVPAGTILLMVRGMGLAKHCPIGVTQREMTFNQDLKAVLPNGAVSTEFLAHWLRGNEHDLMGIADEAAHGTKRIQSDRLLAMPIRVPPDEIQHKIAAILSAYDDLIENNLRRIRILEEMAQLLYREWFVHYRFPGHEGVAMVDSELGEVPEGWEAATLGDVFENFDRMRKPLSKKQRAEIPGPYPYYGAAKVLDHVEAYLFDGEYLMFAEDGTVQTDRGTPVLQYVNEKFWANNHTHIITGADNVPTLFLYHAMNDTVITGFITGAAQPKITQTNMKRIPIIRPTSDLLDEFVAKARPMRKLIWVLENRNTVLRQTRNLLLPRLISGHLDVSDLDIDTGVAPA